MRHLFNVFIVAFLCGVPLLAEQDHDELAALKSSPSLRSGEENGVFLGLGAVLTGYTYADVKSTGVFPEGFKIDSKHNINGTRTGYQLYGADFKLGYQHFFDRTMGLRTYVRWQGQFGIAKSGKSFLPVPYHETTFNMDFAYSFPFNGDFKMGFIAGLGMGIGYNGVGQIASRIVDKYRGFVMPINLGLNLGTSGNKFEVSVTIPTFYITSTIKSKDASLTFKMYSIPVSFNWIHIF